MKMLKPLLAICAMLMAALVAAAVSVFRSGAREECWNEASTVKTHADGRITRYAEEAIATRHLIVKKGTAANEVLIADAEDIPIGVCLDEPGIDEECVVALFGASPGTLKVRAGGDITIGAEVYGAADGEVTALSAVAGTYYKVGRALTAGSDGNLLEIIPCYPVAVVVSGS